MFGTARDRFRAEISILIRQRGGWATLKRGLLIATVNTICSAATPRPILEPATVPEPQEQSQQGSGLEVKISPAKSAIAPPDTLSSRVEISNTGTQDLFVCRDFFSGTCDLRLSFDPVAKVEHAVASADCVPYEWERNVPPPKSEDFAKTLAKDWVLLPPGHFYGATIELSPGAYPELGIVGHYRINGRFSSGGLLGQYCYYKLKGFSKEVADLPAKSWQGTVDANSVTVRVIKRKN
jgi:hypothetical protein